MREYPLPDDVDRFWFLDVLQTFGTKYRDEKHQLLGFFIDEVMNAIRVKANPESQIER